MKDDRIGSSALSKTLTEESACSSTYLALVVASSVIATLGLLENNAAVIIGAMIIAPLIVPIQALSFGAVVGDWRLLRRSVLTVGIGVVVSIAVAVALELIVALPVLGPEIVARSKPTLLDLGIALAAGAVSGFAKVRPSVSATIAGTAIAVALMPPICVIGISLAAGHVGLALGSSLLYVTNLFGITLASMIVYRLAGHVRSADRGALITAVALTAGVAVPLGVGFVELLRYSRLESTLRTALVSQTVTFKHVELVQTRVDWLRDPPVATLTVRSTEPITPIQVTYLERFAREKTGQRFTLVFDVTPIVEVRGATPPPE